MDKLVEFNYRSLEISAANIRLIAGKVVHYELNILVNRGLKQMHW